MEKKKICNIEIWKDIKGYEGIYQVSNYGRVKSLHNKFGNKELIMKLNKKYNGYYQVRLKNNGESKDVSIHRLVALHFIPNPENKPQVNHINEDKSDNRAENLEWCTSSYNNTYGTRIERVKSKVSKPVLQYDLNGNFIKEYLSLVEASKQNNFSAGNICNCCYGRYSQANGYIWKYKEVV